jgi:alpha-1,2-mannosyltransferase
MTTSAPQKKSWHRWTAWGFWLLIFLAINTDVARYPARHNTSPTYRLASTRWWAGQDPYTTNAHAGFLYFPQAAILFTPFTWGPLLLGEFLWRLVTFGLFAYALVRLHEFFPATNRRSFAKSFLILSLLAVPSSFASLRNAQFDLPLAALIVLTAAEIASERWTAAAVWLCLALALKPLAAVPLLLFGALYWKLIPRVLVGLLVVIALPFLHWNPAFVAHEYVRCFQTLAWASKGDEPRYSDLAALLSHFGYTAPELLKTVARVLFALVYLGLGAAALRRLNRSEAAWVVGALSADYLMLFNPRTETCSYVFLGPFVASLALFYGAQAGRKWLGYGLGFAALGLACDAIPKTGNFSIHDLTDRWFKPLIALFFLPVLIQFILETRKRLRKDAAGRE